MADESKSGIREKFGIDFLIGPSGPSGVSNTGGGGIGRGGPRELTGAPGARMLNQSVERALAAYGYKILDTLRASPSKSQPMFAIVDTTGIGIDALRGVIERMGDSGMVEIISKDKHGNDVVRITPIGEESLA